MQFAIEDEFWKLFPEAMIGTVVVRGVDNTRAAGDIATAETEFRLAAKKLDRAGIKRSIHPNAAARTKSRLAHLIRVAKDKSPAKA